MVASGAEAAGKWSQLLPQAEVKMEGEEWPHGVIARGESVMEMLGNLTRTPEVVIVDGGCIHKDTGRAFASRHLRMWGRVAMGRCTVWMLRERVGREGQVFRTDEEMAVALDDSMQRRMRRAYERMGGQRFRWDVKEADFGWGKAGQAMAVQEADDWGSLWTPAEARGARFWEWPEEPATEKCEMADPSITGVEMVENLGAEERRERAQDLARWTTEGQTWWGALLPATATRMREYLRGNARANEVVARAVAGNTIAGNEGPKFGDVWPDGVNEIIITQDELRPGARGKIWSWETGRCQEVTPGWVTDDIEQAGGFVAARVQEIAAEVGFRDKRAIQMLTETGSSHGTKRFPLTSYAGRNHQGAGRHHAIVTKMMKSKVAEEHFEVATGDDGPAKQRPDTIPFGVVPMGGTVQRQKDKERYEIERHGGEIAKNVRGTYNGSFPHDGTSPNDSCEPDEGTARPWVTLRNVVLGACILKSIGATSVQFFKLDLKAAYTQLIHQKSQRWRQTIFWSWMEGSKLQGGYMRDKRMEWGMAYSGTVFFRAVTSLMVRWIERALVREWMPHIQDEAVRKWMRERAEQGLGGEMQGCPGFCHGFLDDFWIFIAGSLQDIALAKTVVMKAFYDMGFHVSESKLETEGTPAAQGVILGHDIDLNDGTVGVTEYKRVRARDLVNDMQVEGKWKRKLLESLLGLLQSMRCAARRRWRMDPLCAMLRRRCVKTAGAWLVPSAGARRALRRIMDTLTDRRPINAVPTRWVIPTAPTVEGIVNTDASSLEGYGGALLSDGVLLFFSGKWREDVRAGRMENLERKPIVDIAVLEALTVIVAAATWGSRWSGKKVVLRSDSSPTCFCFNKLASKDPAMARVADLWEAAQHFFSFEGLVLHCSGVTNELADRASRKNDDEVQASMEEAAEKENVGVKECVRVPAVWKFGDEHVDILDELIRLTTDSTKKRNLIALTKSTSHPPSSSI